MCYILLLPSTSFLEILHRFIQHSVSIQVARAVWFDILLYEMGVSKLQQHSSSSFSWSWVKGDSRWPSRVEPTSTRFITSHPLIRHKLFLQEGEETQNQDSVVEGFSPSCAGHDHDRRFDGWLELLRREDKMIEFHRPTLYSFLFNNHSLLLSRCLPLVKSLVTLSAEPSRSLPVM
jgi:hypothetical protein